MTQVSRLSRGSFSQYYFYGTLQWIINNLSMCGNFPNTTLTTVLANNGNTVMSLFLCIIITMKYCQVPIRQGMTETTAYPSCRACSLAMTWMQAVPPPFLSHIHTVCE